MVQTRMSFGAPAGEAAEIARLMLASAPESPGAGALAVAAWAAHRTGDEDAEHRYARELLARAELSSCSIRMMRRSAGCSGA